MKCLLNGHLVENVDGVFFIFCKFLVKVKNIKLDDKNVNSVPFMCVEGPISIMFKTVRCCFSFVK